MTLAVCLNTGMSAEANWLANLIALVDAETPLGAKPRAGYQKVADVAGLDVEYVYQLYTGIKKRVGPKARDKIASAYADGRDLSWIDLPPATKATSHAKAAPPTEPRTPPPGFADRREVNDSDWQLLQDIKDGATDDDLKVIRQRAQMIRERADRVFKERMAASATTKTLKGSG